MNMKEVIVVILSSTVLSGIVTSLFTFIINSRNNRLKYITEDRRTWRKEIRDIVDEIYAIRYPSQIKGTLAKLKVRINPYGKGKTQDYIHDSHIWELIERIEENPNKEFAENKNQLALFLSLLLKYDWDRSKKEVLVNVHAIILFIAFMYGMSFLIHTHFVRLDFAFNELFLNAFMVFLMLPIIIPMFICEDIRNTMKNKLKGWDKKWKKMLAVLGYGVVALLFIISIVLIILTVFEAYGITLEYLISPSSFPDVFSVVVVMAVIFAITRISLSENHAKKYADYIHEIMSKD